MLSLSRSSTAYLQQYISGERSLEELYEWLIGEEYAANLSSDERAALGSLRAIALEVADRGETHLGLDRAIIELMQTLSGAELRSSTIVNLGARVHAAWAAYCWDAADMTDVDVSLDSHLPTPAAFSAVMTAEPQERPALQELVAGLPQG